MSVGLSRAGRLSAPVAAGAVFPLGLAPYDLWLAIPVSTGLFCWLLLRECRQSGFLTGWLYGLGLFGSGASWVYVSIHVYGHAAPPLAGLLTALFCAGLALLFALQGGLFKHVLRPTGSIAATLAFPCLWVLFEWLRSWLLTGFPWLYAGYAALDTPLAGWAPVIGVYGVSFLLVMAGSGAAAMVSASDRERIGVAGSLALIIGLGLGGALLEEREWTEAHGASLSVAIYQPNIPLEKKWDRRYFRQILDQYTEATAALYEQADLVLWPESALPAFEHAIPGYLAAADRRASATGTSLITGIPVRAASGRHNSIIGLGDATGRHHKQKLVPFGEYVPLEAWLRGAIAFFDLPMSSFTPGPSAPPLLQAGAIPIAAFICYEVVYPDFVLDGARGAELLITVSNDSWFGDSIGPLQHLQMARFRALETGRMILRGTNNGVSAIIDHRGDLEAVSAQFVTATLTGDVQPRTGSTPIMQLGYWPLLILCVAILGFFRYRRAQ